MGTARRCEKASQELTAIIAGLEGRAKSARGFRERRGEALDLGAVPWAGERPGRQKGGLGDARHGAPLALKTEGPASKGLSLSFGSNVPS